MTDLLSNSARSILQQLEPEEAELTYEKGAGFWLGNHKVSTRAVNELLRLCLIRVVCGDEAEYCDYGISGDGRKLLRDPNYVPTILKELRKRTG